MSTYPPLQEELEAYDKHQRKLEDALDQKTAELIALRKAALEHAAVSPMKVRRGWCVMSTWCARGVRWRVLEHVTVSPVQHHA